MYIIPNLQLTKSTTHKRTFDPALNWNRVIPDNNANHVTFSWLPWFLNKENPPLVFIASNR